VASMIPAGTTRNDAIPRRQKQTKQRARDRRRRGRRQRALGDAVDSNELLARWSQAQQKRVDAAVDAVGEEETGARISSATLDAFWSSDC
jgi:hypothetical protein